MKATCKKITDRLPRWEVKQGNKKFAAVYYPNEFTNYFQIEFYQRLSVIIDNIPDLVTAIKKCCMYCSEFYGIDKITDKSGYEFELLGIFEDPMFNDVV